MRSPVETAYPRELEAAVVLPDGTAVRIRPIRPDDADGLRHLYDRLSRDTAYQRFFKVFMRLPPEWAQELGKDLARVADEIHPISDANSALSEYHRGRRQALATE